MVETIYNNKSYILTEICPEITPKNSLNTKEGYLTFIGKKIKKLLIIINFKRIL